MGHELQQDNSDIWMQHMRRGEFSDAWKLSDAVLQARVGKPCWHLPRHLQYVWDGSSLEGKRVLIRCYHGLGDTIQFIRYVPLLKAITKKVMVWAQPPLIPLLQTIKEIDQLLPLHNDMPAVDFDVELEVMELPHIFRTTLSTIPSETPYLYVKSSPLPLHSNQMKVGLVWKAGDWDARRSISFHLLQSLFSIPNITFYILQQKAKEAGWQDGFGIYLDDHELFEYAQIIKSMDLIISVDSMPAHLAGALGVTVWTLLHTNADWRWMEHRDDSPWYPTMRLFRQEQPGNWETVIQSLIKELKKYNNFNF